MQTQAITTPGEVDTRLAKALERISSLLVPGERIEAMAPQIRLFALLHRRELVVATSGRLLTVKRHLIAGYAVQDTRWQDVHDARIDVGIFGATLTIEASAGNDLSSQQAPRRTMIVRGLHKEKAQAVYRICQAQEQVWREKRRVRDLEEMRAKSGGLQLLGSSGGSPAPGTQADGGTPAERLARAREMLQQGLIADTEYEAIKAKIIASL